ncbi:hypothetical protein ZHAS_00016871 [Anopheles sinensis]|uniref:Uncharacterized protein n=1 Tax=Anopheles sinensis TaxID=74873 RepID=A0A084WEB5_ANOSI|nr:hypothetical protein ZHAS_00016871 [Anopheles sinensis]
MRKNKQWNGSQQKRQSSKQKKQKPKQTTKPNLKPPAIQNKNVKTKNKGHLFWRRARNRYGNISSK